MVYAVYENYFFELIILNTINFKFSYLLQLCHIVNIVGFLLILYQFLRKILIQISMFIIVFYNFLNNLSKTLSNFDIF